MGADDEVGGRLSPETDHSPSLAERSLCRYTPEVGAVCGKVARPDLCGGREVTRVPTATSATARIHRSTWRRGGVAARGTRAAARANAAHRRAHERDP